jgi:hypothetical protein
MIVSVNDGLENEPGRWQEVFSYSHYLQQRR